MGATFLRLSAVMPSQEEIDPQVLPHRDCAGRLGYIVVQKRTGLPEMAKAMPAGLSGEDMAVYDMPALAGRRLLHVSSDIRNSFAVFPVITYIGEECPIIWDGKESFAAGDPNLNNPADCVFDNGPRQGEPYTAQDHYEAQLRWGMAPYISIELDPADNEAIILFLKKGQDRPEFRLRGCKLADTITANEIFQWGRDIAAVLELRFEVSPMLPNAFLFL